MQRARDIPPKRPIFDDDPFLRFSSRNASISFHASRLRAARFDPLRILHKGMRLTVIYRDLVQDARGFEPRFKGIHLRQRDGLVRAAENSQHRTRQIPQDGSGSVSEEP
jgi:hypothetical protein